MVYDQCCVYDYTIYDQICDCMVIRFTIKSCDKSTAFMKKAGLSILGKDLKPPKACVSLGRLEVSSLLPTTLMKEAGLAIIGEYLKPLRVYASS